jgi:hypothetical protein
MNGFPEGGPTVGVEEEFFLVDPGTGEPVARNREVVDAAARFGVDVGLELTPAQVETATPVCHSMPDGTTDLRDHPRCAPPQPRWRSTRRLSPSASGTSSENSAISSGTALPRQLARLSHLPRRRDRYPRLPRRRHVERRARGQDAPDRKHNQNHISQVLM